MKKQRALAASVMPIKAKRPHTGSGIPPARNPDPRGDDDDDNDDDAAEDDERCAAQGTKTKPITPNTTAVSQAPDNGVVEKASALLKNSDQSPHKLAAVTTITTPRREVGGELGSGVLAERGDGGDMVIGWGIVRGDMHRV